MTCRSMGTAKHKCCDEAVKKRNEQGKEPELHPERGYKESTGAHDPDASRDWQPGMTAEDYFKGISGRIFPDGAILNPDKSINRFVEYKFQCPAGTPTGKDKNGKRKKPSAGTSDISWTPARTTKSGRYIEDQRTRTIRLGEKQDPPVTEEPELLTNMDCPK